MAAGLVALAALAYLVGAALGGSDGAEGGASGPRPRLDGLSVTPVELVDTWNETIGRLGVGDALVPFGGWARDEGLGLDLAEQTLGPWGFVEVYRRPDGALAAVDVVGGFATTEDRTRFAADAVAAVAGALALDLADAAALVRDGLGLGDGSEPAAGSVERGAVTVALTPGPTSAQLRINAPRTT